MSPFKPALLFRHFVLLFASFGLLNSAMASDPAAQPTAHSSSHQACVEQAKSSSELDQCGGPLLKLFEERIETEYKRVSEKFAGNAKMQEFLKTSRSNWELYRNNQCALEASVTTGNYVVKPFSLEANRAYFKCMARTFGEMKSTLEKF